MAVYKLETRSFTDKSKLLRRRQIRFYWRLADHNNDTVCMSRKTWTCAAEAEESARAAFDREAKIVFVSYTGSYGFYGSPEPVSL